MSSLLHCYRLVARGHRYGLLLGTLCILSASQLAGVQRISYPEEALFQTDLCSKVTTFIDNLDESTPIKEIARLLCNLRDEAASYHEALPSMSVLFLDQMSQLQQYGYLLPEEAVLQMLSAIEEEEESRISFANFGIRNECHARTCKHHDKNKRGGDPNPKEHVSLNLSPKTIKGWICVLSGGILYIIPTGLTQGAGIVLIGSGIQMMIDGADEPPEPQPQCPAGWNFPD